MLVLHWPTFCWPVRTGSLRVHPASPLPEIHPDYRPNKGIRAAPREPTLDTNSAARDSSKELRTLQGLPLQQLHPHRLNWRTWQYLSGIWRGSSHCGSPLPSSMVVARIWRSCWRRANCTHTKHSKSPCWSHSCDGDRSQLLCTRLTAVGISTSHSV
jgi:hypothetical protein